VTKLAQLPKGARCPRCGGNLLFPDEEGDPRCIECGTYYDQEETLRYVANLNLGSKAKAVKR
jgi:DNA-directed RNA polymerase subunit RPC12/RpoP